VYVVLYPNKSDITNEVSGTGYTATGNTLASVAASFVASNSFSLTRANSTAYALGQFVRPATGNGSLYKAIVAGTSAGTVPTYPTTLGGTVVDGGVTWECVSNTGAYVFDAADTSWTTATITARYAVVYDSTPASDATRPLIGYLDFVSDQTSTAGTFAITFDAGGLFYIAVP
jgi:hypothetical protein